ncbi:MAG: ABC transporter ATP-binding protein [Erysipelotrichaceae bacterium]|jgi:oligopeptide transport system ATP-binding protein|nr:ABC transporter ATP-binding protein [Erysipelotrichaceae bacterium]
MMSEHLLEVENLKVGFSTFLGKVQAVRDISFFVDAGETLAIVGESGSGKTQTCRSIMRMLAKNGTIESGSIRFHGEDLLSKSEKAMQDIRGRDISMIFQDPMTSLDPTMPVGRQIGEALTLHKKLSRAQVKEKVEKLLATVGIENPAARRRYYPHQFSGGQRQRIVIAIALANDPQLIIADEPTTALDVSMQAQILQLLKQLQKEYQSAVIFITHDLAVVANIADRVAVMYGGKIVEIGTREEIFTDPRHPYTWGLLQSLPQYAKKGEALYAIAGSPPDLIQVPKGDAFAARNPYALEIDFKEEPPLFAISKTHYAATWLLDPRAPKVQAPKIMPKTKKEVLYG